MEFEDLKARFGEDTARMICEELGGDTVYFPKLRSPMKPKIIELWTSGHPIEVIAERVGCSKSWAWRVVRG